MDVREIVERTPIVSHTIRTKLRIGLWSENVVFFGNIISPTDLFY